LKDENLPGLLGTATRPLDGKDVLQKAEDDEDEERSCEKIRYRNLSNFALESSRGEVVQYGVN
jgi:hypothetical protein